MTLFRPKLAVPILKSILKNNLTKVIINIYKREANTLQGYQNHYTAKEKPP